MPITRKQAVDALQRHDVETHDRLAGAQAEVARLQAELAEAKAIRFAVIEEAMTEGWTQARVGRALGMTRQRVGQLRREGREHEG
jgi:uncharacterized small protein (DUF1192 family)